MKPFAWNSLARLLKNAHTWIGQQTFTNINVTGGAISGVLITDAPFATSTNPGVSAATTTAIVDANNGVLITTNVNNAQTIGSPTVTTAGKRFTVINNDTSSSSIIVNGITLVAGKAQTWVWDGTAWVEIDLGITSLPVLVTQGGTGLATITDHGIMLGSGTGAVTPTAVGATGEVLIGQTGADPVWSANPSVTTLAATVFSPITSVNVDSSRAILAAEMRGQTLLVTGAYTPTLPTAVAGYNCIVEATTAAVYSLDPVTGTDVIELNGTSLAAGNKATSDGSKRARMVVKCYAAGTYVITSVNHVAVDGGA
jgi:hypothetical protein